MTSSPDAASSHTSWIGAMRRAVEDSQLRDQLANDLLVTETRTRRGTTSSRFTPVNVVFLALALVLTGGGIVWSINQYKVSHSTAQQSASGRPDGSADSPASFVEFASQSAPAVGPTNGGAVANPSQPGTNHTDGLQDPQPVAFTGQQDPNSPSAVPGDLSNPNPPAGAPPSHAPAPHTDQPNQPPREQPSRTPKAPLTQPDPEIEKIKSTIPTVLLSTPGSIGTHVEVYNGSGNVIFSGEMNPVDVKRFYDPVVKVVATDRDALMIITNAVERPLRGPNQLRYGLEGKDENGLGVTFTTVRNR